MHELGEIDDGDITPHDGVNEKNKHALEEKGIRKIFSKLYDGDGYIDLWLEFDENKTPEARFVKQIDKLEMAMQAAVYAKQYKKDLGEFDRSARERIEDGKLIEILNMIKEI